MGGDNLISHLRDIAQRPWRLDRPYRLFDERSKDLGVYYVSFRGEGSPRELDRERTLCRNGQRHPIAILQFGLELHTRWRRTGDEEARELFLAQAEWAATAQLKSSGVRGTYEFPAGFRSAMAQGEAISLLLRAYQETGDTAFLGRAIDASVPLTVGLREGGVMWEDGDDVILQGVAGAGVVPAHILSGWICALWGLLELWRTANVSDVAQLYRRSLATLEKYLPCYDSGTWSYEDLLTAPTGFRRVATVQRHLLHLAQLNVLLSMTSNAAFAAVAERWHRYAASPSGRLQAWVDGVLAGPVLLDQLTADAGARSII